MVVKWSGGCTTEGVLAEAYYVQMYAIFRLHSNQTSGSSRLPVLCLRRYLIIMPYKYWVKGVKNLTAREMLVRKLIYTSPS